MYNKRNPYLRKNQLYEFNQHELSYRINCLFKQSKYKNGLYLHEIIFYY